MNGIIIHLVLLAILAQPAQAKVVIATYSGQSPSTDAQLAEAACSKVNLTADLGPVRDQENNGNCYAQVAADMVTQYVRGEDPELAKDKFQASAMQLQIAQNKVDGTFPGTAAGQIFVAIDALKKQKGSACSDGFAERGAIESSNLNSKKLNTIRSQADASVMDAHDYVNRTNVGYAAADDFYQQCQGKIDKIPKVESYYYDPAKQTAATVKLAQEDVDNALGKGRICGIGIDAKILSDTASGGHAVSIVAREYSGGACWYAIRNSWGTSCKNMKAGLHCANGYTWMKATDLMPQVFETDSIPATKSPKSNTENIPADTIVIGGGQ